MTTQITHTSGKFTVEITTTGVDIYITETHQYVQTKVTLTEAILFLADELKLDEAMDDYTKNITVGGDWICDGTNPCAFLDSDHLCDHPDHM